MGVSGAEAPTSDAWWSPERASECGQVEGRIRAGPRPDLEAFVAALARLEDSIAFFQQNRCRERARPPRPRECTIGVSKVRYTVQGAGCVQSKHRFGCERWASAPV